MRFFQTTLLILALLTLFSCEKEIDSMSQEVPEVQADGFNDFCAIPLPQFTQPINFTPGSTVRNFFTIDGATRTFRLYVPPGFPGNPKKKWPIVFMFHGRGQNNSRMLVSTSWNQVADAEDLIIVYPQAMPYDLNKNCPAGVENKTAWNTPGIQQQRVPGQVVHDDVKFVKAIRNSLLARFPTTCSKFYAAGFSNGGAFVKTILRVEMDYAWTATFSCGGIGLPSLYPPDNGIYVPHWEIIGNRDLNARRRYLCPSWNKCCIPGNLDPDPNNWIQGPFGIPMIFLSAQCGVVPTSSNTRIIHQPASNRSVIFVEDGPDIEYKFKMLPQMDHEFPGPLYDASSSVPQAVDHTGRIWNWMRQF